MAKKQNWKLLLFTCCFQALLLLGLWLRLQGTATLPPEQFTETDAYHFYRQAHLIEDNGRLPPIDTHRWVPLGRDLRHTLNLYPYVLAYTYKALAWLSPNLTLYHICVYAPAVWFCIVLAALGGFLYHAIGARIALLTTLILATLPATIERSVAGFGDRDAWCLMLGTKCLLTYLAAYIPSQKRKRLFWTLASGVLMFLGGMSWEAFPAFALLILALQAWHFLTTSQDERLALDALWAACFVPTLLLAAPAYRSGLGFAAHLTALMLAPPVVLCLIRLTHYLLLRKSPWTQTLLPYAKHIAWTLTLFTLSIALGFLLHRVRHNAWTMLSATYQPTPLFLSIGELSAPHFGYWPFRYGSVFIIGSLGLALAPLFTWQHRTASTLSACLSAFAALVFFRHPLDTLWQNPAFGNALFVISGIACLLLLLKLAGQTESKTDTTETTTHLAMLLWALLWITLARDAKRHDFFIGIPLAYFTATFCVNIADKLTQTIHNPKYTTHWVREKLPAIPLKLAITTLFCLFILLWGPADGGHLFRTQYAATQFRTPTPGHNTPIANALYWMQHHLNQNAVVAAEWSFGPLLNVLAGVKTITDTDHYLPHWIHFYHQHVRFTTDETEALTFLKTHRATHLLITEKQPHNTMLRASALSDAFVPVYPTQDFENAPVKLWALRYPPHIQADPKYLARHPTEHSK